LQSVLHLIVHLSFYGWEWTLGQTIDAVTGTRRVGFCISLLTMFCLYAAGGIALCLLLRNSSLSQRGHHGSSGATQHFTAATLSVQ
jgi:hypothetical protein